MEVREPRPEGSGPAGPAAPARRSARGTTPRPDGLYPLLLLLGACAFWLLRIRYWAVTEEEVFSDMANFDWVARRVLSDFDFAWSEFWQSYTVPTLPLMRAAQIALFGEGLLGWQVFQAAFVFGGLVLVLLELRKLDGPRWLPAGLLLVVACSRSSIFWSLKLSRESVAEGFIYWGVAATLWALRTRRPSAFLITGLVCAAAMLNRPNFATVVPLFGLAFLSAEWWRTRAAEDRWRRRWEGVKLLAAFTVGLFLLWSPWLVRSYRLYGEVVPLSTQSPYSFLWEFGEIRVQLPDGGEVVTTMNHLQAEAVERFANDREAQVYAQSVARAWLRQNWREYIRHVVRRIGASIGQRVIYLTRVSREDLYPGRLDALLLDKSVWLVVAGFCGLALLAARFPDRGYVLLLWAVVPWLTAVLFLGYPRILEPMLPAILFGALFWFGTFVGEVVGRWRAAPAGAARAAVPVTAVLLAVGLAAALSGPGSRPPADAVAGGSLVASVLVLGGLRLRALAARQPGPAAGAGRRIRG